MLYTGKMERKQINEWALKSLPSFLCGCIWKLSQKFHSFILLSKKFSSSPFENRNNVLKTGQLDSYHQVWEVASPTRSSPSFLLLITNSLVKAPWEPGIPQPLLSMFFLCLSAADCRIMYPIIPGEDRSQQGLLVSPKVIFFLFLTHSLAGFLLDCSHSEDFCCTP